MNNKEFIIKLKIMRTALSVLIRTLEEEDHLAETIKLRTNDLLRKIDNLVRFL